jgi:hypothetical protein
MRRVFGCALATVAAGLVALVQGSCGKSAIGPIRDPSEELILDVSFEQGGQPTLEGWRVMNPSLTTLVPEAAPGGGRWSLGLEADWAPTTGFVTRPIPGIEDGDVLRLSAYVRAVDADGGGSIALAVGPSYELGGRIGQACTSSTSWTVLSVQDTVVLAPGDTVWVALSSPHTEVARRQGRFDRVRLTRIRR